MKRYMHLFATTAEHQTAYDGETYEEPWVGCDKQTDTVTYNKKALDITPSLFRNIDSYCSDCISTDVLYYTGNDTIDMSKRAILTPRQQVYEGEPAVLDGGDLTLDPETFGHSCHINFSPNITSIHETNGVRDFENWPFTSINGQPLTEAETTYGTASSNRYELQLTWNDENEQYDINVVKLEELHAEA